MSLKTCIIRRSLLWRLLLFTTWWCAATFSLHAQNIKIGGNVYGGGNAGDMTGDTKVVVLSGDIQGGVFGGARQANVGGSTYVNIDGAKMSGDITINYVYGGNDIAGSIGTSDTKTKPDTRLDEHNHHDDMDTYNAFILTTPERKVTTGEGESAVTTQPHNIFIGQLFGAGNGDYQYTESEGKYIVKNWNGDNIVTSNEPFVKPNLGKTYLDIHGGTFGYVYGGGNNATVTDLTNICINNTSTPATHTDVLKLTFANKGSHDGITKFEDLSPAALTNPNDIRLLAMGINLAAFKEGYNFNRIFGGNNKADMHIMPKWHLDNGKVYNLFSGGNEGRMTSPKGLLLEVGSKTDPSDIEVDNVYGGCRKADVYPSKDEAGTTLVDNVFSPEGYHFPKNFAARVLVRSGKVKNVYGGNDISGRVYFGNAVGIYTSISGNVYGGGNGSYAYTDREELKNDLIWGDLYYNPGSSSVDALNAHRPNAEQVSVRLAGTSENQKTTIGGSVFLGGNCATLESTPTLPNPTVELKIGSHVIVDKVFLGNNGESMKDAGLLGRYAGEVVKSDQSGRNGDDDIAKAKFSDLNLTNTETFAKYMEGVTMNMTPSVVFDNEDKGDPATYEDYSTYIGSFYCGGNVGSMRSDGATTIDFNHKVIIFNKLVGGCNDANVDAVEGLNAAFKGGLLRTVPTAEDATSIPDRLTLNLSGLKLQPLRWNGGHTGLEWNTYVNDVVNNIAPENVGPVAEGTTIKSTNDDKNRRFIGGNIYGGCYNSGHVDGNVTININSTLVDREGEFGVFDSVVEDEEGEPILDNNNQYDFTERRSGVILDEQGNDVLGAALNVFGGGYGEEAEIWGCTAINLKKGYSFQIFGGGEKGAIGRGTRNDQTNKLEYTYNAKYSTTMTLHGEHKGVSKYQQRDDNMAECEYLYGGGFEGVVSGNTQVNLGDGRVYESFGGSCNANILGHTETYVGMWRDKSGNTMTGFPWIRNNVYGSNDLGGSVLGNKDFSERIRPASSMLYQATPATLTTTASAYVEYVQGRAIGILGGCYGDYDYQSDRINAHVSNKPFMTNAFVNIRPEEKTESVFSKIFGAGEGNSQDREGDKNQDRSYVLIDIPDNMDNFKYAQVFGAGSYNGLGMSKTYEQARTAPDEVSAIIDLVHGKIGAAYGGSYNEGVVRRTMVNVPQGSTVMIGSIFGGGYGTCTYTPCDVYESNVNYHSSAATLIYDPESSPLYQGEIYGGNNNERRTLYGRVTIDAPVVQKKVIQYEDEIKGKNKGEVVMTNGTVFGAGRGGNTWSEYTEVNLKNGAKVFEVYGGGQAGKVHNAESVYAYMMKPKPITKWPEGTSKAGTDFTDQDWAAAWKLGSDYDPEENVPYWESTNTNLANPLARNAEIDDRDFSDLTAADFALIHKKYNTNVIINRGATVKEYAYGGGLGEEAVVAGGTYVALLGGTVVKDIYAAGTSGAVQDMHDTHDYSSTNRAGFIATANAYIEGGTVRNVYGGGWKGSVGKHTEGTFDGEPFAPAGAFAKDIFGETHVVIGKTDGTSFYDGIPAIQRNVYGGGEGGPVYGSSYLKIRNGYIGYVYNPDGTDDPETKDFDEHYEEKIHDETWDDGIGFNRLWDSGCVFGGGYIDNSNVDFTNVYLYGGNVRNSVFGGGEIAAIGRGKIHASGENNSVRQLQAIFMGGKTTVEMYGGHVFRNVYAGGRGYNNLGEQGKLYSDGYVFGHTEIHVHGGEVGTEEGLLDGYGNVFGGGDIGYVYSAYQNAAGQLCVGKKAGNRFDDSDEGYYYKNEGGTFAGTNTDGDGNYKNGSFLMSAGNHKQLTEDCKVLVEPFCKVKTGVTLTNIYYPKDASVSHLDQQYLKEHHISTTGLDANGIVTADNGFTIESRTYAPGEYVSCYALNTLKNKTADADKWTCLEDDGIIIHNAIFAGGNTSPGSAAVYANATSVFGNATASIHDVYHRDLITMGTGHTSGLYGDGNLTFIDGYRGLNITNYGTDYYNIETEIDIDTYHALPAREAAYYELRYVCTKSCTDKDGTLYTPGSGDPSNGGTKASTITADEFYNLFDGIIVDGNPIITFDANGKIIPNPDYWKENGVCSRYAGRLMNSIQRADFCGVFGSRMVMQGALDRVPETVDYTNYTINRVREVSLNKKVSRAGDEQGTKGYQHGNYFGIYNIVNYLGALTSDVRFDTGVRTTDNSDAKTYKADIKIGDNTYKYGDDGYTFYNWKQVHKKDRNRNNGNSHNQVALASGVYLELTTEKSTGKKFNQKDWGIITGVIELDLINVQQGIGGGFVYAKNVHGVPTYKKNDDITLTALNRNAVTRKDFEYADVPTYESSDNPSLQEWQTSGNFVHSTQTIIDDCYNISAKYKGTDRVPAHYWYIKGSVYLYDQYISAYTGAANAYSEAVDIPLVISAASHGEMKLMKVKKNLYAYYSTPNVPLEKGKKVVINDVAYQLNDPITYWDWYMLSPAERKLFVEDTYVSIADCKIGSTTYAAGTVLLPNEYNSLRPASGKVYHIEQGTDVDYEYVFRSSNNLAHETGYILTYDVNNPGVWDKWYTPAIGSALTDKLSTAEFNNQAGYNNGPTYRLKDGENGSLLGQRTYLESTLISKNAYDDYQTLKTAHGDVIPTNNSQDPNYDAKLVQAEFNPAYIVTVDLLETTKNGNPQKLYKEATLAESEYTSAEWSAMSGKVAPAYICKSTVKLNATDYIYVNTVMTESQKVKYLTDYASKADVVAAINENIVPAYYCTKEGLYGGDYYQSGTNYRGLQAWCSMSETDREKFTFNYDALDLLIDPTYCYGKADGQQYQYDGDGYETEAAARNNKAGYSLAQPVNYTATYYGDTPLSYKKDNGDNATATKEAETELTRTEFERLLNEQRHYSPIPVKGNGTYYVVKEAFIHGDSPYAVGQSITSDEYKNLNATEKEHIESIIFNNLGEYNEDAEPTSYYYCREGYTIATETNGGKSVTSVNGVNTNTYNSGNAVPQGIVITAANYELLVNNQKDFIIHGISPIETSTLYVSNNSDLNDLTKDKVITVIYQYNYEESDESSLHITPVSERHVVNIHIKFKSGIPEIEDITKPKIVLPGTSVSLREPKVTPGAYEVTGGGWTLFDDIGDAENHTNGIEYRPTKDPLYWYQHNYYIAYYAKSFLGKTYSNAVPVSVANYHDLHDVMSEKNKAHHMYVDHPKVLRESKIYINDYSHKPDTDPRKNQNGLDLLKDFFDLSLQTEVASSGRTKDHALLDSHVHAGDNLEFFLRTDLDHSGSAWTPIAESTCFEGTLHGDGHTISGLTPAEGKTGSLFSKLCGNVFNLGVMGSFTGGGIADEGCGYAENCWVSTTGTPAANTKAIIGNPTRTSGTQIVNCYYPVSNTFDATDNGRGIARKMPDKAFYNGEVAYDLNGFYLNKRYFDNNTTWTGTKTTYQYLPANGDGTLPEEAIAAKYPDTYAVYHPVNVTANPAPPLGYVENRYYDGDFRYAGGTIPDENDIRQRKAMVDVTVGTTTTQVETDVFNPVWPNDYLFFGQTLNYGYVEERAHQDNPSSYTTTNRVYRAPAYFRNGIMDVAHFNPDAVFAQTKKGDASVIAYKDMTAIDFTGYNDVSRGYQSGIVTNAPYANAFFPPLLDDNGLTGFKNINLTKNLLAYTFAPESEESASAAGKTGNTVSHVLDDEAFEETDETYRTVAFQDTYHVRGHWVQNVNGNYKATFDHFLVDREDFYAPISYTFDEDHRMWYQRYPDLFTDKTKGWESISLPFSAQLVTTNKKGEITHFYRGSNIGHEYWLRELKSGGSVSGDIYKAKFEYPEAVGIYKKVTNTFLWDYYYNGNHNHKDWNADTYQTYYKEDREYENYPPVASGTPYIIGFPGVTYYEFDLSGQFNATTTGSTAPYPIDKQYITFASATGATINASDSEMAGSTEDGYTFKPNYLNMEFKPESDGNVYAPNADGSGFDKVATSVKVEAFRPYFSKPASSRQTRSIVFVFGNDEEEPHQAIEDGTLDIRARRHHIVVTSALKTATDVRIVAANGVTIKQFTIEPGETIENYIVNRGVYIVQSSDGQHVKKLAVK